MKTMLIRGALAVLLLPCVGATPASANTCDASSAIQIPAKDIVMAPRQDRLLVLINFSGKLGGVPAEKQRCTYVETAKRVVAEKSKSKSAATRKSIEVIIAFVDNMDEYNRPNYGGMKKIGLLEFSKSSGAFELSKQNFEGPF